MTDCLLFNLLFLFMSDFSINSVSITFKSENNLKLLCKSQNHS